MLGEEMGTSARGEERTSTRGEEGTSTRGVVLLQ